MMKKNYNRDQFKRIFSFFAAVLLVGLYAAGFAWVWYESYSDAILLPFYRRGNWVMILIYVVLVLLFAKSFGGLKIGYLKRTDMFYSQTLSIFCVNVVTYFQISVVNRDFSAAVPMILLTIADLAVLILWIVLTNRLCFRLYPPRKLVVIYGDRNAAELVLKMSRRVDKNPSVPTHRRRRFRRQLHGTRVLSSVRFPESCGTILSNIALPRMCGRILPRKFRILS